MALKVDKQTREDLNLSGKYKPDSILNLFDRTITRSGSHLLEKYFREPLDQCDQINARSALFACFKQGNWQFPVDAATYEAAEQYLNTASGSYLAALMRLMRLKIMNLLSADKMFDQLVQGMQASAHMLSRFGAFLKTLHSIENESFRARIDRLNTLFNDPELNALIDQLGNGNIDFLQIFKYEHTLKNKHATELRELMDLVPELDVCIAVGDVAREYGFARAQALVGDEALLKIEGVYHPRIRKAVTNDLLIDQSKNVFFLTGANMAGKSTFMKSVGISVYLAHIGFPVAASRMEFHLYDGMFTSINVSDDISLGYSHFYAEVRRVKTVAETVAAGERLLVIFDELFKGTNVKDAFDATVAVTEAFGAYQRCSFIISTHITEAGHELGKQCNNIQFHYIPTIMQGNRPTYTYRLNEGITEDRHGMMIIRNEHILDIIARSTQTTNPTKPIL